MSFEELYKHKIAMVEAAEALKREQEKLTAVSGPYQEQSKVVRVAQEAVKLAEADFRSSRREQLAKQLQEHPELVDVLAPEHALRCSDTSREEMQCPRCFLLESAQCNYVDPDVDWVFAIRIFKEPQ